jgi:hypothetical protein
MLNQSLPHFAAINYMYVVDGFFLNQLGHPSVKAPEPMSQNLLCGIFFCSTAITSGRHVNSR